MDNSPASNDITGRLTSAAYAQRLDAVSEILEKRRDALLALGQIDLAGIGATLVAALEEGYFEPEARAALARWPAAKGDEPFVIALIALGACGRALDAVMAGFTPPTTH